MVLMKLYMLDTDTCSYLIRKRPPSVMERFQAVQSDQILISVITQAELLYGIKLTSSGKINQVIIEMFLRDLTILPWDSDAGYHYAEMRAHLKKKGIQTGNMDLMIAAHARSRGAIVVTNNVKDYKLLPGVFYENWFTDRTVI